MSSKSQELRQIGQRVNPAQPFSGLALVFRCTALWIVEAADGDVQLVRAGVIFICQAGATISTEAAVDAVTGTKMAWSAADITKPSTPGGEPGDAGCTNRTAAIRTMADCFVENRAIRFITDSPAKTSTL